ncbi:protein-L-isoaspartate(D-aspartate) O-methyltransferase [Kitasatospora sp. MAP12-15]|uniref:methyltransferase, FxLD system n=1 Tax=unclassified Kitasatospora TaxID=2633591 RepID=UPI00247517E4|nr:methyltransferase, FxLD system [Kitasatospora sp. MAP12-44]MDH6110201.1 protein-L-isoaspartate(D-aspartate) O-methyltransferase [Kitasatospora sp. MAP12-44]
MSTARWHQHNIEFTDRERARQVITSAIGPAMISAEAAGLVHSWWYMNKQPWPLRYLATTPDAIGELLDKLAADGRIISWDPGIYDPETFAFGGAPAMDAAHALFHHDSHHLLTYDPSPGARHLDRRETAILLCSAMMRAAGLDWYEQGDVWDKVAELRPLSGVPGSGSAVQALAAMRRFMTVNVRTLCNPNGPLTGHDAWVSAFEHAGQTLAHLARRGQLTRALRAVVAHHLIFHANRAGLPLEDQSAMSKLAREVVMGTSENTASSRELARDRTSLSEVNSDTIEEIDTTPERLRNALVDQVIKEGRVRTPRIEEAMRTVPRHMFVPAASLEEAYANSTVDIKQTDDGTSISCASQPGIIGLMLEQLQPQPGDKVLELGAGSGYNAGLLAHLVGENGHVTTIDVDDDLVEGARSHLAAAGIKNVTVLKTDGALGHPDGAPYNSIIAAVGAHAVPHAWMDQLAPGGRLLVPQRLRGSVSRSIAYEQKNGAWVSIGSEMNTFMPLREGVADDDRHMIPLTANGSVRLQTNDEHSVDVEALADVLEQPRTVVWSDVYYRVMESPEWMELWLTCTLPSGLNRMLFKRETVGSLLTDDPYPSSTAAFEKGALTYLARRLSTKQTPEGGKLWEFGVVGHGPGSADLAARVAESMRTWDREYRDCEARFEIQPLDAAAVDPAPGRFVFDTPLNRIVVEWQ